MSEVTNIEWCDCTWNPWTGCRRVSPGCAHCYMFAMLKRFGRDATQRQRAKDWTKPLRWNREAARGWRSKDGNLFEHRPRVFPSMMDWLDSEVPIKWLADLLKLIHDTPNLDWLLLTKRPENFKPRLWAVLNAGVPQSMHEWLYFWVDGGFEPKNVWIGVSVEDRVRKTRIDELREIPAVIRFLSLEPLLEDLGELDLAGISWVIVGGESGPGARPCSIDWIRGIVTQCRRELVRCFVKQLGRCPTHGSPVEQNRIDLKHNKGGDPSEWSMELRVREFPEFSASESLIK